MRCWSRASSLEVVQHRVDSRRIVSKRLYPSGMLSSNVTMPYRGLLSSAALQRQRVRCGSANSPHKLMV